MSQETLGNTTPTGSVIELDVKIPREQREREAAEERAFAQQSQLRKEKRFRKKQRDAIRQGRPREDPVSDVTSSEPGEEVFGQENWDSSDLDDDPGY